MASQGQGQAAGYYNEPTYTEGPPKTYVGGPGNDYSQGKPPQTYTGGPGQDYSQGNQQGYQSYGSPDGPTYAPPQDPPPQQYNHEPKYNQQPPEYAPPAPNVGQETFQETFKMKPKWNDLWAGVLFIATVAGFIALSGIVLYRYSKFHSFNGGGIYGSTNDFSLDTNTIVLFAFVISVAFAFSWGYFLLARHFTKAFVWITGILNCVMAVGTAIYYLYRHLWGAGIVFALFAVFAIFCFISWIPRIPFAVVMLQQTMDVARLPRVHVFLISLIGGIIGLAFSAYFSVTMVAIYTSYMPSNASSTANPSCADGAACSSGKVIGLLVFATFTGYWVSEWLKNTIHTTVAGVYGSWYFCAGTPGGIPKGATMGSLRRATSYSFGSISLGSLIVAIINLIRQACSIAQQQSSQNGNIVGVIFFCCLQCVIGLIDWAVQFINKYAFAHIALYGKAYFAAAKDTWTMMKDRGIDALINDCLIGPVLSMGALFVGYLCALLSYLYLEFTKPAYNEGRTYTPVIMAFAFIMGLQICHVFTEPIASGVNTIFVAMAWDPQVAVTQHPEFWAKLVKVYPKVQHVIQGSRV